MAFGSTARALSGLAILGAMLWAPGLSAADKPKTHLVHAKQTLGKIAKRYNATVDALREANHLAKGEAIKPGQRLCIPPRTDPDGTATRVKCDAWRETRGEPEKEKGSAPKAAEPETPRPQKTGVSWHTVHKGQHLGMIAKRYRVTVAAIEGANEVSKKNPIIPGQKLLIPSADDVDGSAARALLDRGPPAEVEEAPTKALADKKRSWDAHAKKPSRRDYLILTGRKGVAWQGVTLTKKGNVRSAARDAIKRVLATSDGEVIDIEPRLIQLLTEVSNTFGGRPVRVVSGYRLGDTTRGSRHRTGHAIDFVVDGVPNEVVRDYVKTFDAVGVGFYPNSHFIHLDVRDRWTYWVDYAGPGQPPRYAGFWTRPGK